MGGKDCPLRAICGSNAAAHSALGILALGRDVAGAGAAAAQASGVLGSVEQSVACGGIRSVGRQGGGQCGAEGCADDGACEVELHPLASSF